MNENRIDEILKELSKPFHPSHVTWKPGVFNRDRTKALALAYADLRAYQNRLDEVCGMDRSVSYTPWGDRIVCHLTIQGVTRSSTGEPDSQSEKSEIAGTAAEAQAFKRACAMFGLGRYLYNLPSLWAEFDAERKGFTEAGRARLSGVIVQHYRRHVDPDVELQELHAEPAESISVLAESAPVQTNGTNPNGTNGHVGNGHVGNGQVANGHVAVADVVETQSAPKVDAKLKLHNEFNKLGQDLYGEQWETVRVHNVERISGGKVSNSEELDSEALQKLVNGLKKLKRQRKAA